MSITWTPFEAVPVLLALGRRDITKATWLEYRREHRKFYRENMPRIKELFDEIKRGWV